MKTIIIILAVSFASFGYLNAQNLYSTSNGETSFFSETPVENIAAVNKFGQAILNTSTNDIVVQMNMKQFDFPNKLMQEHFNENYIESAKYPKAVFKGKINEKIDFTKNGTYDIAQGSIGLTTDFEVALTEHNIEVPKVVFMKIAQTIQVKNKYSLAPYVSKK
jgi:hypothetical protein